MLPLFRASALLVASLLPAAIYGQNKAIWKSVEFAIVKIDDQAPKSWNMYHTDKRGVLLLRMWKRYLLIDLSAQQVFDIDPRTVTAQTDSVAWSTADKPAQDLDISEWKERNVGSVDRVRFRLPNNGPMVELQLPLRPDGKSLY
jgi:hypothetical protein